MSSHALPTKTCTLSGQVRTRFLLALLLPALMWIVGCGGKGPANVVKGKVTLNDQVVAGTVYFADSSGKEVGMGPIGPDGSYQISDPPKGTVQVLVKGMPGLVKPAGTEKEKGAALPEMPGGGPKSFSPGVAPPAKYASPNNGLTYDVKGGKETYDIKLTP